LIIACSLPPPPITIIFIFFLPQTLPYVLSDGIIYSRKGHYHAVLVAGLYHRIVTHGATRLRHIGHAAEGSPVYIIAEGEEGIAAEGNAGNFA
jgi:hypothetical protein